MGVWVGGESERESVCEGGSVSDQVGSVRER